MASDRFVNWTGGRKPTKSEIEQVIRNFFGEAGTVEWNNDRFMIALPGRWSHSLKGIVGAYPDPERMPGEDERWIEVHIGRGSLDVITRRQDDFTNALADGLARLFARFWDGDLDDS